MAGVGPTDLYAQTQELFGACVDALDTIPLSDPGLGGAPDRAYISQGDPAMDCCDQLVVSAIPIREAPTQPLEMGSGTRHQQQFRKNYVSFRIWITRCGPTGPDIPYSDDELQAVAEQCYADAWALWNYTWNLVRSGDLFTLCGGVYFDSINPLTPSGGCYGSLFNIRAELEGYEGT